MTTSYDSATVTYDSLIIDYDGEEEETESMSWFSATSNGSRWVHVSRAGGFGFR